ncbi:MAG TPA: formyl transferase [Vicinamibacterales bacterium]|nr:formyl transferase [Vicinamibacterales bacterium]
MNRRPIPGKPRVIVLTSTFLRHHYLVNTVAAHLDLVGVWQEQKSFKPQRYADTDEDHQIIAAHFTARDRAEDRFFGDDQQVQLQQGARTRVGPPGLVNEAKHIEVMAALEPDVVLVFGTGLLGPAIIERFSGRIINLHLGLSPFYRGSGTNFWPLVNGEPEYVGATIHYLDEGIDTGPIIAHARPAFEAADGPHEIGNRAIVAGTTMLMRAAYAHLAGPIAATPQHSRGRLYQRKDFSAAAVRSLAQHFASGMIPAYLADQVKRDAQVPLIALGHES